MIGYNQVSDILILIYTTKFAGLLKNQYMNAWGKLFSEDEFNIDIQYEVKCVWHLSNIFKINE